MKLLRHGIGRRSKSKHIQKLLQQDIMRQAQRSSQPPLPLEDEFAESEQTAEPVSAAHTIMFLGQTALVASAPPLTIGASSHFVQ